MAISKNFLRKSESKNSAKYSAQDIAKIRERAYFVWLKKGKPANSAFSDWLEAEKELKKEGLI